MHSFSNLFLIKYSTCFGQIYCPSPGVSTPYTQHQVFVMLAKLTVWTFDITNMKNTYCCIYSVETPDDGQQICPKHAEFFIKNKFEKQCITLAFIIRKKTRFHSSICRNETCILRLYAVLRKLLVLWDVQTGSVACQQSLKTGFR